ncbi:SDR family NAD(P)-dependent oxidoreductase [Pelagibius sp.]|uniref:SDR family NAD(P)-dependent oxidoreductase n=1 Tax=Pelagibius sp. TaxID=1931238 RepID=UPI002615D4EE|nr:glucose 1-dehydrogenase [Pelagibius sp.]
MSAATDLFDLDGRAALVTGASSGLGRHAALVLARAGAKVGLAARRLEPLVELEKQIEAQDGRAIPLRLDVTDRQSVAACVDAAETELGPLSILVNNAGVADTKPAFDVSEADWDRVVDTNLKGAWLVAQEVGRHMARLGHGGSIINLASVLSFSARAQVPAYCASKGGLVSLTKALAVEWARHDIRVNALAPGYIETDLNRDFLSSPGGEDLRQRIPMRRFGQPADLDGALLLLASEASRYISGSVLLVDGGQSAAL